MEKIIKHSSQYNKKLSDDWGFIMGVLSKKGKTGNWKQIGCLITVIGALQFMIMSSLAMVFYPGGYSVFNDYLSHLGLTKVNGGSNTISFWLWIIATNVAGLTLIPFWLVINTLFTKTRTEHVLSSIGMVLGVISGPFLMGIGIFPADTRPDAHEISTIIFFLLFAIAIAIYSIAILYNTDYPNLYAYVGVIFSIVIVLFIGEVFAPINVAMQKIIVYGFVLWVVFQVTKVWDAVSPPQT